MTTVKYNNNNCNVWRRLIQAARDCCRTCLKSRQHEEGAGRHLKAKIKTAGKQEDWFYDVVYKSSCM